MSGKALLIIIAIVAVVVTCCYAARSCNTGNAHAPVTTADSLMIVRAPADMQQQMLYYEGFTVSFNKDLHIPNYVAWELLGSETDGPQSRKGMKFATDSHARGCATDNDYRGSGFDRGHMAPAGDMKWSARAMTDCFYFTNMCPQSKQLNTGSWKTVEDNCRKWAERDSALIIVCGPVLTDRLTQTIGKSHVAVPQRFFKVVLAPWANPPRAIGFIMNNGRVEGGAQRAACTVDQVEAVTGLDFFSALPDDIENQVESQCNYTQWQRQRHR